MAEFDRLTALILALLRSEAGTGSVVEYLFKREAE